MKTKRFLVAVCLLVVSATLLGSASFAWFSMNTEVGVDGIEVEAYSDSLFLEISKDDSAYATAITLDGDKQYLRVTKHDFVTEAYTVALNAIEADTYYDGATYTYYKKVVFNDSYEKYVFADEELVKGTELAGYYKDLVFTKITDRAAKAEADTTYYNLVGSKYVAVTDVTAGTTEVVGYYTLTAKDAETTGNYDGTGTYYEKIGNDYAMVTLERGTNLKGYYTVVSATKITDNTKVTGKAYVRNEVATGNYEYSLLGDFAAETDITSLLYFGRTYSDVIDDGNEEGTLNVIKDAKLDSYRYANTFYIRNAVNTNDSRNLQANITVGGEQGNMAPALRVVLVASIGGKVVNVVTYDKGEDSTTYANGSNIVNLLQGNQAETLKVDVYVYFDGTDDVSNNADNGTALLGGQTVEIKFTIDGPDYN